MDEVKASRMAVWKVTDWGLMMVQCLEVMKVLMTGQRMACCLDMMMA